MFDFNTAEFSTPSSICGDRVDENVPLAVGAGDAGCLVTRGNVLGTMLLGSFAICGDRLDEKVSLAVGSGVTGCLVGSGEVVGEELTEGSGDIVGVVVGKGLIVGLGETLGLVVGCGVIVGLGELVGNSYSNLFI